MLGCLTALLGVLSSVGQTGTQIWTFATQGNVYASPAIGSDGSLYFGSMDGKVYALNPDGTRRWEFVTKGGVASSPALGADESIYVGSLDSKVYCLTPSGTSRWEFVTGNQVWSSPAIAADGTIYIGSMDERLYALSPSGARRWQFVTGGGIFSSPAVAEDGTVYVGSRDNRLYAINPDGTKKWDFVTGFWVDSSPAIGPGGTVYVGSRDGKVYALDPGGAKLWEFNVKREVYSSPAVGPDGTIYVGAQDWKLHALSPYGYERWSVATTNLIVYSSPAVSTDGTICIGSQDGSLYAFSPDGSLKWVFTTGSRIDYSSPVIGPDGTVYVGSNDAKLYALKGMTGLAGGPWPMFRRDIRHTASGFVIRDLPAGYSPGGKMVVKLQATPPPTAAFYAVVDTPPAGWQVGLINNEGLFDPVNRKVKFGPFLDGLVRVLTYEVTPSAGESGLKQFCGVSSLEGADRLIGGDQAIPLVPLHPADNNAADGWLSIGELTAYSAAWRRGTNWSIPPSPVPLNYVNRAVNLWLDGEQYRYDTNFVIAPLWWVSVDTNPFPSDLIHTEPVAPTAITNGTASATLPPSYIPGVPFDIVITVTPAADVVVYAVEDLVPEGWEVTQVSDGGTWDALRGKVKWGPFFDSAPRTTTYRVRPPPGAADAVTFSGVAAFDGAIVQIRGRRQVFPSPAAAGSAERDLPGDYSAGATLLVTIRIVPPMNTTFYVVQDTPPNNWSVGVISDNGFFDTVNKQVKFGPFLDGQARALTYEVTPPQGDSGLKLFAGTASFNGLDTPLSGDESLSSVLLHPADISPVDAWVTIAEMTGYGAAWKRGLAWPIPPNPIPAAYLDQALVLWRGGEEYHYDTNKASAPDCWVNLPAGQFSTNGYPPGFAATATPTNGTAVAVMPKVFQPGLAFDVAITVSPVANLLAYALEDQPPLGWAVEQIDNGGFFDAQRRKVKWGPFFDNVPRTLMYRVSPPSDAMAVARFYGVASFENTAVLISGRREAISASAVIMPALGPCRFEPAGGFDLVLSGIASEVYVIEASTDLIDWQRLGTIANPAGSVDFLDPEATNFSKRFYRALWP